MPRFLRGLFFPGGCLAALAIGLRLHFGLEPDMLAWLERLAPALLVAGLLLAWRFHRSGPMYAATALLAVWAGLRFPPAGPEASLLAGALMLVLPLNLLLFAGVGRHPQLRSWGMFVLAAQALALAALLRGAPESLARVLQAAPLVLASLPVPQLVAGVWLLAGLALLARQLSGRGTGLWSLLAAGWGLVELNTTGNLGFGFSLAGCLLLVELVEMSYRLAYRDELTGLPGRRALAEALDRLPRRAALAMCDIDHFKKLNDRYGHANGDLCLQWIARQLERASGGGRAFRFGGEEFAMLFPGLSAAQAVPHLEAMCAGIRAEKLQLTPKRGGPAKPVGITLSIGVAELQSHGSDPRAVLKVADEALYQAKRQGRNKVCEARLPKKKQVKAAA